MDEQPTFRDRLWKAAQWFMLFNVSVILEIVATYQLGPWVISLMGERLIPPAQAQARAFIEPLSKEQFGQVDERLNRSEKMLSRLEKLFPRRVKGETLEDVLDRMEDE